MVPGLVALLLGCAPPSDSEPTERRARRMVTLAPSFTEIVTTLGATDRLVARTDFDTDPAVAALPSVGGGLDPSHEVLVQTATELVLVAGGRDAPALASALQRVGISVETLPTQTIDDLFSAIDRIGELVDRSAAADALAREIQTRLDAVRNAVSETPPIPVMYVVWSDPPMSVGSGSYLDELLTLAGGTNIFSDSPPWPTVSFESIVAREPAWLIWPRGASSDVTIETIRNQAGWRDVEAVRAGRVAFVDADLFNRPGPKVAEAAETLAAILHPEHATLEPGS